MNPIAIVLLLAGGYFVVKAAKKPAPSTTPTTPTAPAPSTSSGTAAVRVETPSGATRTDADAIRDIAGGLGDTIAGIVELSG